MEYLVKKLQEDNLAEKVINSKSVFEVEKIVKLCFLRNNEEFYNWRGNLLLRDNDINLSVALNVVIINFICYFWYFKEPNVANEIIWVLKEQGYDQLAQVLEEKRFLNMKREEFYKLLMN